MLILLVLNRKSVSYKIWGFVVSRNMSWLRAVWRENGDEVEGVIPTLWCEGSVVRWPLKNPLATAKCHAPPCEDWLSFDLIKKKFSSGNTLDFIGLY